MDYTNISNFDELIERKHDRIGTKCLPLLASWLIDLYSGIRLNNRGVIITIQKN